MSSGNDPFRPPTGTQASSSTPAVRLEELRLETPAQTQSSADTPLERPTAIRPEPSSSRGPPGPGRQTFTGGPLLRAEDERPETSSLRPGPPSATPSFEGLHLPGSDQPLRIPSPHPYPGTMTEEQRNQMIGVGHELPRTPTQPHHTQVVTPLAKPLPEEQWQKWLKYEGETDPEKMSHEQQKQLRHVQVYNHEESRQARSANNANRMHDQNYLQRAKQHEDNFGQRGNYYATNIQQRDWYYTNSLQLRKRGEEQRDRHQDANFQQRDQHQAANFQQRDQHQAANFQQRNQHHQDNLAQRDRHHREAQNQRWWLGGGTVAAGVTVGLGTYALRQSVSNNDQTAQPQPMKRFVDRDGPENANAQQTKRFVARDESDPVAGFNPHGAARHVRMYNPANMGTPSGLPSNMDAMLPDNKRPVKQPGDTGLTAEELAQLGQPHKPVNPYGDLTIRETPRSDPAPESKPATEPNPVPKANPAPGSKPAPWSNPATESNPIPRSNPAPRSNPRRPIGVKVR